MEEREQSKKRVKGKKGEERSKGREEEGRGGREGKGLVGGRGVGAEEVYVSLEGHERFLKVETKLQWEIVVIVV